MKMPMTNPQTQVMITVVKSYHDYKRYLLVNIGTYKHIYTSIKKIKYSLAYRFTGTV